MGFEDGLESKQTNPKYNDQVQGKDNRIQFRCMSQGEQENWMSLRRKKKKKTQGKASQKRKKQL